MRKFKNLLEMFFTMMKIGLFTFGGGYVMMVLLENEFVQKKKWLDHEEFLNIAAIAESTPGPFAINTSTYIGYRRAGLLGSLVTTLGVCIPSFVIVYLISLFFDAFLSLTLVAYAFRGIQAAVVYLIFTAGIRMLKQIEKKPHYIIVTMLTVVCMLTFTILSVNFSTIFYILIGGAVGVAFYLIAQLRKGGDKDVS